MGLLDDIQKAATQPLNPTFDKIQVEEVERLRSIETAYYALRLSTAKKEIALNRAMNQFIYYKDCHLQKKTADGNIKAKINQEFADMIKEALDA